MTRIPQPIPAGAVKPPPPPPPPPRPRSGNNIARELMATLHAVPKPKTVPISQDQVAPLAQAAHDLYWQGMTPSVAVLEQQIRDGDFTLCGIPVVVTP